MTKPLLNALKGEIQNQIPIWLMRQAGRYLPEYRELRTKAANFLDFCYRPELSVTATLQPIERFGFDGAIIFSAILVIPDALGQKVAFEAGRGPVLDALDGGYAVEALSSNRLRSHLAPVYEAIETVAGRLAPETTLIGFAGAPWTIASYMIEGGSSKNYSKLKTWAYGDPERFTALVDLLVEAISAHLSAQIEAGADTVQIFDSWAGILPEDAFDRWCVSPIQNIITRVKADHPDTPIIVFPNRAGLFYERIATRTGADCVSIDTTIPLGFAKDVLQKSVTVQGNIDPVALVVGGNALKEQVHHILEGLGSGPFVFNLGHGILPETPPEHVAQLVGEVRAWRK
jgi:uroporphyrinogen decarboxylase